MENWKALSQIKGGYFPNYISHMPFRDPKRIGRRMFGEVIMRKLSGGKIYWNGTTDEPQSKVPRSKKAFKTDFESACPIKY